MKFAQRVYLIAGVYGLVIIVPLFFMEAQIGRDTPPAITHPEYFYGFLGVTLAWQVLFLLLSRDPLRYRPLMLATILEKAGYGIAIPILFAQGRVPVTQLAAALIDICLGVLFVLAYLKTAAPAGAARGAGVAEAPAGQTHR